MSVLGLPGLTFHPERLSLAGEVRKMGAHKGDGVWYPARWRRGMESREKAKGGVVRLGQPSLDAEEGASRRAFG